MASPIFPVIDYSRLVSSDSIIAAEEKDKLFQSFHDVGFIYLKGYIFTDDFVKTIFSHIHKLFDLPEEQKLAIEGDEKSAFRGWFAPVRTARNPETADQKEAFGLGNDADPTRPNRWPKDWPEFRNDCSRFFEECFQMHLEILRALTEKVGLPRETLVPSVQAKDSYTALLHYPETTVESFDQRVRSAPHTDFGTLTLLFNDSIGGLQVRNKQGEWCDAPPIPGHAIVNVADLLARWFNNRLKSTEHRVVAPPVETRKLADGSVTNVVPARYAIAWFGHPNRDAVIKPLAECIADDYPQQYEAVIAGKHVKERMARLLDEGKLPEKWSDDMHRKEVPAV
ncbi:Putative Isopenicillin N synthase and related dioxygenases [Penicillium brasilianum]|uniref:Putative Isopenicillin N synthase and related dioxygenases n=1 Tax=Penicillium brasilianum TaxID=104259 RepID=A0A0F7TGM1_PENBI|nr:Putative Isopenicillin N synthase and related dioxygenases [Penicillium brasilianum]